MKTKIRSALFCALLLLVASGCSTLNTTAADMRQAADDFDAIAGKLDTGEMQAAHVSPILREHAVTLRAWAGQ